MASIDESSDVAVIGLGVMGAAAAAALAHAGLSVTGFDTRRPPHDRGSSHGESRVIRQGYWEDPRYVPLVKRAWDLWSALASPTPLIERTGALLMAHPDGAIVRGAIEAAKANGLAFDILDEREVKRRFPRFDGHGLEAVHEPDAGFLRTEACVQALLAHARTGGARLLPDTPVRTWYAVGDGYELRTARGTHRTRRVVLACGAWMGPQTGLPLRVERQVLHWYRPDGDALTPRTLPVFAIEETPGDMFYGIPDLGTGLKVARHHHGTTIEPDDAVAPASEAEIMDMTTRLRRRLPGAHRWDRDATCKYTNTPDEHFVLGPAPDDPDVFWMSPCSGHGFKFAPALGAFVAEWARGERSTIPELFAVDRFA